MRQNTELEDIIRHCTTRWGQAFAERAVRPLIYSFICRKWIAREGQDNMRYRLNILFFWERAWFKSTILGTMNDWIKAIQKPEVITAATSAALRGSVNEGQFVAPAYLVNDIIIVPELSSILDHENATMGQMLTLLEEGEVGIRLIKISQLTDAEQERIREMENCRLTDNSIRYKSSSTTWIASHTIDVISPRHQDAFVSRFLVIRFEPSDFPRSLIFRRPLVAPEWDRTIKRWLREQFERDTEPDHEFADAVIQRLRPRLEPNQDINPRSILNLYLLLYAHRDCVPDCTEAEAIQIIEPYIETIPLSTRDQIVRLIMRNPMPFCEIHRIVGTSESNIYNHLNRLKAQKTMQLFEGEYLTHYYLEAMK